MSRSTMIVAMVAAGIAGSADAGLVDVQYTGKGKGSTVKVTFGSTTKNVFAGQLKHTIMGGLGADAVYNGEWLTYCSELTQSTSSSVHPFSVVPLSALPGSAPMGAARAAAIFDVYAAAGALPHTSATTDDYATAFQVAIWEIINDFTPEAGAGGLSLATGAFSARKTDGSALPSSIVAITNTLFGAIGTGASANIAGISNGSKQDQIVPIPAPGAAAMAGVGLVLIARRHRR
ncbi:MAG: hypothetical protein FJ255_10210 [Phycisphaerae bacterium]|nr:hypothetical protein [Phycisphaerae bacterium]